MNTEMSHSELYNFTLDADISWEHTTEITFKENYNIKRIVNDKSQPEIIDRDIIYGTATITSTAGDITIVYCEGFKFEYKKPKSLRSFTGVWEFEGLQCVDSNGDEVREVEAGNLCIENEKFYVVDYSDLIESIREETYAEKYGRSVIPIPEDLDADEYNYDHYIEDSEYPTHILDNSYGKSYVVTGLQLARVRSFHMLKYGYNDMSLYMVEDKLSFVCWHSSTTDNGTVDKCYVRDTMEEIYQDLGDCIITELLFEEMRQYVEGELEDA